MKDEKGNEILLGDILDSEDGYSVKVVDGDGHWVGILVCQPGDSCEDIIYALNNGKGYTKRNQGQE